MIAIFSTTPTLLFLDEIRQSNHTIQDKVMSLHCKGNISSTTTAHTGHFKPSSFSNDVDTQ